MCFLTCLTRMVIPNPEKLRKFLPYVVGIIQFIKLDFFFNFLFNLIPIGTPFYRHREPEYSNSYSENYRKMLFFFGHIHTHTYINTHAQVNPERL